MAISMQEKLRNAYAAGQERGRFIVNHPTEMRRITDLVRATAKVIGWTPDELRAQVEAYDRERLDAVPDLATYPELRGYRDVLNEQDRGMLDAGVPRWVIAINRTLDFYRMTRLYEQTGKAYYAEAVTEKCRVLYVPHSPDGMLHAKNVDDPAEYFTPQPPTPPGTPWPFAHPLMFDGVGSGLHIDEIPPEIFPVAAWDLCREHCTTVPEATEFLVRYNYFWSGGNLLVHDAQGNSVAFEKTTCRVATRGPNRAGINYITGMGASDPEIAAHQKRMRQKYLDQVGSDWNGPDGCFWRVCEKQWQYMGQYVEELSRLSRVTIADVNAVMEKREPDGPMCLTGEKSHPDQPLAGWTLQMRVFIMDRKQLILRQYRDGRPAYLDTPEVIQYV